jgi:2-polyprenyl-3-methyl-5-hydroxy-6-metoxy-1,4-benzoquinol methylase
VLDLGCGVGRHALLFAEHGFAVEAIDGAAAANIAGKALDQSAPGVLFAGGH